MNEPLKTETDNRSFDLWFYVFGLLTVVLIVRSQGISVESAHTIIAMIFVKQMGRQYKNSIETDLRETNDRLIENKIKELSERVDKFDPYSDDNEKE